jgi:hypothetical protein
MNDQDFKRIENMMVQVVTSAITNAVTPIYERLDRHEIRFDGIDVKLDHISTVVDEHSEVIVELQSNVVLIKKRMDSTDYKVDKIEQSYSILKDKDRKGYNDRT